MVGRSYPGQGRGTTGHAARETASQKAREAAKLSTPAPSAKPSGGSGGGSTPTTSQKPALPFPTGTSFTNSVNLPGGFQRKTLEVPFVTGRPVGGGMGEAVPRAGGSISFDIRSGQSPAIREIRLPENAPGFTTSRETIEVQPKYLGTKNNVPIYTLDTNKGKETSTTKTNLRTSITETFMGDRNIKDYPLKQEVDVLEYNPPNQPIFGQQFPTKSELSSKKRVAETIVGLNERISGLFPKWIKVKTQNAKSQLDNLGGILKTKLTPGPPLKYTVVNTLAPSSLKYVNPELTNINILNPIRESKQYKYLKNQLVESGFGIKPLPVLEQQAATIGNRLSKIGLPHSESFEKSGALLGNTLKTTLSPKQREEFKAGLVESAITFPRKHPIQTGLMLATPLVSEVGSFGLAALGSKAKTTGKIMSAISKTVKVAAPPAIVGYEEYRLGKASSREKGNILGEDIYSAGLLKAGTNLAKKITPAITDKYLIAKEEGIVSQRGKEIKFRDEKNAIDKVLSSSTSHFKGNVDTYYQIGKTKFNKVTFPEIKSTAKYLGKNEYDIAGFSKALSSSGERYAFTSRGRGKINANMGIEVTETVGGKVRSKNVAYTKSIRGFEIEQLGEQEPIHIIDVRKAIPRETLIAKQQFRISGVSKDVYNTIFSKSKGFKGERTIAPLGQEFRLGLRKQGKLSSISDIGMFEATHKTPITINRRMTDIIYTSLPKGRGIPKISVPHKLKSVEEILIPGSSVERFNRLGIGYSETLKGKGTIKLADKILNKFAPREFVLPSGQILGLNMPSLNLKVSTEPKISLSPGKTLNKFGGTSVRFLAQDTAKMARRLEDVTKIKTPYYSMFKIYPKNNSVIKPIIIPTTKPTITPTFKSALIPSLKPALMPALKPALTPATKPQLKPALMPALKPALTPALKPNLIPGLKLALIPSIKTPPFPFIKIPPPPTRIKIPPFKFNLENFTKSRKGKISRMLKYKPTITAFTYKIKSKKSIKMLEQMTKTGLEIRPIKV